MCVSTLRTQMPLCSLLFFHPHITTWLPPIWKAAKCLLPDMCLEPHQENIPARQQLQSRSQMILFQLKSVEGHLLS